VAHNPRTSRPDGTREPEEPVPQASRSADVVAKGASRYNAHVKVQQTRRTYAETLRFFDGMQVVPPGLVQCHRWRPDPGATGLNENVSAWGGVARKD
jgi:hypothetical protein